MLSVEGVTCAYGRIEVLHDVSLRVDSGETVSVIGPNGAGKTTLVRTISGLMNPVEGDVTMHGQTLVGIRPSAIARRGVVQVPEGGGVLRELSVRENLVLVKPTKSELDGVLSVFPRLSERWNALGETLSGGERQMLSVARALLMRPSVLILDEPSFGLAPRVVSEVFELLSSICREEGVSVLLVEQNVVQSLGISDRGYVLNQGKVVLEDDASALLESDQSKFLYTAAE